MNRAEFFRQLEQQLQRIPKEEASEALEYYREYFDEAGPENEKKVIEELGSPGKIVTHLKAEVAMKKLQYDEAPTVKKGISAIWWVLIAIFAAPIALPLVIGVLAVVIGLLAAGMGVVVALVAAVLAFFATSILVIVAGFAVIATSVPTGMFAIGVGLAVLGITLLLGILVVLAARGILVGIARLMSKALKKGRKGETING